ncbi:hypothetical protein ATHL_02256, partial [Anaerolinea thermolimosa]
GVGMNGAAVAVEVRRVGRGCREAVGVEEGGNGNVAEGVKLGVKEGRPVGVPVAEGEGMEGGVALAGVIGVGVKVGSAVRRPDRVGYGVTVGTGVCRRMRRSSMGDKADGAISRAASPTSPSPKAKG